MKKKDKKKKGVHRDDKPTERVPDAETPIIEAVSEEEMEEILAEKAPSKKSGKKKKNAPEKPSKKKDTDKELDELRKKAEERDEFLDALQHTRADFDNFQKRVARDREAWAQSAIREFLVHILPPLDDLDRTTGAGNDESDAPALMDGIKLIREKMWKALAEMGLEKIEALGKPFDPQFHEAMFVEESDKYEKKTVMEVFEQGYILGGRVVRPANVKVSKPPAKPSQEEG